MVNGTYDIDCLTKVLSISVGVSTEGNSSSWSTEQVGKVVFISPTV